MTTYHVIQITTGQSLGLYSAECPAAALRAMLADAGEPHAEPDVGLVAVEYDDTDNAVRYRVAGDDGEVYTVVTLDGSMHEIDESDLTPELLLVVEGIMDSAYADYRDGTVADLDAICRYAESYGIDIGLSEAQLVQTACRARIEKRDDDSDDEPAAVPCTIAERGNGFPDSETPTGAIVVTRTVDD